ncbi:unnamed protein product, partial [Ilex paraguariensis]
YSRGEEDCQKKKFPNPEGNSDGKNQLPKETAPDKKTKDKGKGKQNKQLEILGGIINGDMNIYGKQSKPVRQSNTGNQQKGIWVQQSHAQSSKDPAFKYGQLTK